MGYAENYPETADKFRFKTGKAVSWLAAMDSFVRTVDKLVFRSGKAASWLVVINSLVISYDVANRYIGGRATDWGYDIAWMLYAVGFMIGGSYTLQDNGHVRVDLIWQRFSERGRARLDIAIWCIFILPMVCTLGWFSIFYAIDSWSIFERSAYSAWRPYVFPIKTIIPITFLLLFLQAVSDIIKKIQILKRRAE